MYPTIFVDRSEPCGTPTDMRLSPWSFTLLTPSLVRSERFCGALRCQRKALQIPLGQGRNVFISLHRISSQKNGELHGIAGHRTMWGKQQYVRVDPQNALLRYKSDTSYWARVYGKAREPRTSLAITGGGPAANSGAHHAIAGYCIAMHPIGGRPAVLVPPVPGMCSVPSHCALSLLVLVCESSFSVSD